MGIWVTSPLYFDLEFCSARSSKSFYPVIIPGRLTPRLSSSIVCDYHLSKICQYALWDINFDLDKFGLYKTKICHSEDMIKFRIMQYSWAYTVFRMPPWWLLENALARNTSLGDHESGTVLIFSQLGPWGRFLSATSGLSKETSSCITTSGKPLGWCLSATRSMVLTKCYIEIFESFIGYVPRQMKVLMLL